MRAIVPHWRPQCELWRSLGLLWRAGLQRVGLRSGAKNRRRCFGWNYAVASLGLLRSPTRGKPARHSKPAATI